MNNEFKRINTSQKDNFKKHLVSSHQLESSINNFLTGQENLSPSVGKPHSNFNFSSPMKKLKNLRNKSSAGTSASSTKRSPLNVQTPSTDKLVHLDDKMLFGLKSAEKQSVDIPKRTTSLSAFSADSGYNSFYNTSSLNTPKVKDDRNAEINRRESIKMDQRRKNSMRNTSAISSSFDLNNTPSMNKYNNELNINDPPSFTPPKFKNHGSSRQMKRLNLMKCCICEETVREKTSDEKILTLECGHICHDTCLLLHMMMEKEKQTSFTKHEELFPLCELCDDGITICKPASDEAKDELFFKVLMANEEDEENDMPATIDKDKEKTMQLLNEDTNYLEGLPVPDFSVQEPNELKPPSSNENSHMTPPNQIISIFPGSSSNLKPITSKINKDAPEVTKRQSVLKQNFNGYKMTNGSPNMNRYARARTSILHQSSISRNSTLSKKNLSISSPKPIVKKLNTSLPTNAIYSSINTSVDPKGKSANFHSLDIDSDSDDELMIVQIEGDSNSESKRQQPRKYSHKSNLDMQEKHMGGKYRDSISTQTSESIIGVVKERLNLVHQLIERHSDKLNKKNIDTDLGLLRISNMFEVCKVLDSKDTFYLCRCYLFEKMLILDFFDKRTKNEFRMIKISSESVNVDVVNKHIFRVSCLNSKDINIFQFKSVDKNNSKILEKWISALLDFNLEFYDQPFTTNDIDKNASSSINTIDENSEDTVSMGLQDVIIKKSNTEVSTNVPIKSYGNVEDLIMIIQLDSIKKIKKRENLNLINSIKSLNKYFNKKKKMLKFVILDEKSKILCIGSSKDVLDQLDGSLKFEQIRGKILTETSWSNSVIQKYFMDIDESSLNVVVMSSTEMDIDNNCLFNDFYTSSNDNVLKLHVGFLNVDYSEDINDLVEINSWYDMMEILCFSLNLEFGQDDLDYDDIEISKIHSACNSNISSVYTDMTPLTPLNFDSELGSKNLNIQSYASDKNGSPFDTEALYNYL